MGDEGDDPARAVRRLMVTLLDVGSGGEPDLALRGVRGGAESSSERGDSSTDGIESGVASMAIVVSADRLREPPREVLWRFLDEGPLSLTKGLGRVEQGSEEDVARSRSPSRDNSPAGTGSIWQRSSQQRAATGWKKRE